MQTRFQLAFDAAKDTGKLNVYDPRNILTVKELKNEIIPFLKRNPNITHLNLGGNDFGEKGKQVLYTALSNTMIHVLTGIELELPMAVQSQLLMNYDAYNYHFIGKEIQEAFMTANLPAIVATSGIGMILFGYLNIKKPMEITQPTEVMQIKQRQNKRKNNMCPPSLEDTTRLASSVVFKKKTAYVS